ncbi:hypothetical protein CDCA_CDCA20G4817 [Cyanidium caldarium]|uniref:Phosphomannomutase n=1 Tax=Cyanidium caldarium TaxID=2771 RepID=A0AAV9J2L3_CYACA|nr:hypothetical protein CDCA_CDCA20G4817 [Cyanidium caldarium]
MGMGARTNTEELETYLELQNGSDVRGVAMEATTTTTSTRLPVNLTQERAAEIAGAFARWLRTRLATGGALASSSGDGRANGSRDGGGQLRIAVGRDPRLSGAALSEAVQMALALEDCEVYDLGLCTTPAMFMCTVLPGHEYDGALMLTASHLPPDRNGMKFFTRHGGANKKQVKQLLEEACAHAQSPQGYAARWSSAAASHASPATVDFLPVYAAFLCERIRQNVNHPTEYATPLRGLHIVVDAGNGSAGFFVHQVLQPLGACTDGSQFLEPDGTFPNHVPNPEAKEAIEATTAAVQQHGADLGVVFDTDADRCGFVDASGEALNRNRLIALMAAIVLRDHPGATILTDSVTSNGLATFIESRGGRHFRYRKGYKNVIDKAMELNDAGIDCPLAIETSGHGALRENYMLDDGAYLAVKIISELVRQRLRGNTGGLSAMLADLPEPREASEFRLRLPLDRYKQEGARIVQAFHDWVVDGNAAPPGWRLERENYEGWRVAVDEGNGRAGWLLLRPSLHDPLLPLNVESECDGGLRTICRTFYQWAQARFGDVLDLSPLQRVL